MISAKNILLQTEDFCVRQKLAVMENQWNGLATNVNSAEKIWEEWKEKDWATRARNNNTGSVCHEELNEAKELKQSDTK